MELGGRFGTSPASAATGSRLSAYHVYLILLISLSIIFDGFDTYTLGLTVPAIALDWGMQPGAFATVTALATVSTIAGAALAGFVGDRIGRKRGLILATMLYGGGSLISALSNEMVLLGLSRLITGLGLGSAVVTAIVSVAEHTPPRYRSAAITVTTLGIPLGHTLAGATATWVLEPLGWRSLFLIGAVVPAAMIVLQMLLVPETPAFMQGKERYRDALARYCRRTGTNPEDFVPPPANRQATTPNRFAALFSRAYRADTLFLWAGMMASVFITHMLAQWLPSLLSKAGESLSVASEAVVFFGIGQIAGSIVATPLIYAFGSRWPMCCGALIILTLALVLAVEFDAHPAALATFITFAVLACISAQMVTLHHALGPAVYPEEIRGSGTGLALGLSKTGGVVSSFIGAWSLHYGGLAFFGVLGVAALVQFASFGMLKRHAPGAMKRA